MQARRRVWAFRRMPQEKTSGIVNEGMATPAAPQEPIDAAQQCLREWVENGFASLNEAWRDRVRRVAGEHSAAGLFWPAQIIEELADLLVSWADAL